ncbi:MauE/DoxX family redox-associated membrane protein [Chitinophaga sp. RAB17]|uniref:MauE/DoxX family redox-associated membrane protein n=1 Tax=Chitinophaga sp. RAB17 TaxID=3233049 RepID=UPI003F93C446
MKKISIIYEVVVLLFILMFLYAAFNKLFSFEVYKLQLDTQPFDDRYTPLLAVAIPSAEILVSLLLIIPKTKTLGLYLATFLMVIFTGYIVLIKVRYFGMIPCSCGGVITHLTWIQHLWFNLFFLVGGISGIISKRKLMADQRLASN